MALRALTPGKAAFCSACGAEALPDAQACAKCNEPFEGYMDAVLCPICNAVNAAEATECVRCDAKFPPETIAEEEGDEAEEEYLRRILQLSREKAKARTAQAEAAAEESVPSEEPRSLTEEGSTDDLEAALYKLAEPFDQMLRNRRRRLEQMELLIDRARRRIQSLEPSTNPIEIRERSELKRQIEELLLEKEDILKLEEGLVEMENTYRNILRMQQEELKVRETALRGRLDAFRKELEQRERTMGQLHERELDIGRREDEFRRLTNRLHDREKELNQREELLREKARLLDERHHTLSEGEVELERKRWEVQQKASSQAAAPTVGGGDATITVKAPNEEFSELRARIDELEEAMERVMEEKNEVSKERENLATLQGDVRSVMKVLDDLLGELSDDKIREFAKSEAFALYEKILDRLEL